MIVVLQRGKAHRRAIDGGDQRELPGRPRGKGLFIVGTGHPGLVLHGRIILARQILDGGAKDRARIGLSGQHRTKGDGGGVLTASPPRWCRLWHVFQHDAFGQKFVADAVAFR